MRSFIKISDQKGGSVLLLILSDIIAYILSILLSYYIRASFMVTHFDQSPLQPFVVYLKAMPFVVILLCIVFYTMGLYERKNRISGLLETKTVLRAVSFTWLLVMALSFLAKYDYSRIMVILLLVISVCFLSLGRLFIRHLKLKELAKGKGVLRLAIIGAGKPGRKIQAELEVYTHFGFQVVGFIDDFVKQREGSPIRILGRTKDLSRIIEAHKIDEVYIADPSISYESVLELINSCENSGVRFKVVSGLFEIVTGGIDIEEIEGVPSLDMTKKSDNIFYVFTKRLLDIIFALIGLIVFSPIWILIAIGIKLDSPGGVIFAQDRVGKDGEIFKMWKFRTMYSGVKNADFAPKSNNDSRVTKFGRFLRKTSLDEVPQFLNVLIGNMSLVGPRPEMPFIVEKYSLWQRKRLEVKPGITGLWQILGRKDLPLHENIEYDFYYIKNRSLFLDIVIILKTVLVVLSAKGAY